MAESAVSLGAGSTGSRLLRGHRPVFSSIERRFAAFKGTERALFFSSGYLANLGLLTALARAGDVVFSDERNHASLIDGIRLSRAHCVIFPHNDADRLAALVGNTPIPQRGFVVTESLFSMDGDVAPLGAYAAICRRENLTLIVDEAHAVGVCGETGSGLLEYVDVSGVTTMSVNTAGKALGVCGAFVAGPGWAIEYLVQRARSFIFSTAAPPSIAAALDASLDLVDAEPERRQRLGANVSHLAAALTSIGWPVPRPASHIVPILLGANERALRVATELQIRGFDVRAIRPPTVPDGTARLRLSVNAGLTIGDIDRFLTALQAATAEHER